MTTSTTSDEPLRLGWGKFAVVAVIFVVIIGLIIWPRLSRSHDQGVVAAMVFFTVSVLCFLAFRWHLLRKLALSGAISIAEFRADPKKHILGPRLPYISWFIGTVCILFAIVIGFAIFKH
jgi:hypothetical protein